MDRNEKKTRRERVGENLDVSGTRMTDEEVTFLGSFIDEYSETYRGRTHTRKTSRTGWSSEGKYTREETITDTFTDDIGIQREYEYRDDDGQTGGSTTMIKDARGVLNWFKERS